MSIKKVLLVLAIAFVLSGCQWMRKDLTPTPTLLPSATQTATTTATVFARTYLPMCTPPLCAIGTSEVYYCSDTCPNGCGTTCATYTPSPKP